MKIYITKINESWIIDRIKKEWTKNNKKINTKNPYFSEIIWNIVLGLQSLTLLKNLRIKKLFNQFTT